MKKNTRKPVDRRELVDFNKIYKNLSPAGKTMISAYLSALRDRELMDGTEEEAKKS